MDPGSFHLVALLSSGFLESSIQQADEEGESRVYHRMFYAPGLEGTHESLGQSVIIWQGTLEMRSSCEPAGVSALVGGAD